MSEQEEYYDPLLESIIDQVTDPDFVLNGRDQEEEDLQGVAAAPPTPETGGSMLAMDPDQASGEGSKEGRHFDGHSSQEPPISIPNITYVCT